MISYQRSLPTRYRVAIIALLLAAATPAAAQTCPAGNPSVAPDSRYTVSEPVAGQRVVQDLRTGLMWRQCIFGQSGEGCDSGANFPQTWTQALSTASAASFAGHSDWRLPSATELRSLVESGCHTPAMNTTVFPASAGKIVWSSTTIAQAPSFAYFVSFDDGRLLNAGKDNLRHVRWVRGLQSFDSFDSGLDFTPDAYSFSAQTDVPLLDLRTSNVITVSGINTPVGIGVSGAADSEYSINGGPFSAAPASVVAGDSVVVRHTSADTFATSVSTTLGIGVLTADFVSTTFLPTYTVGGSLSGLASGASVVLQNNGGDNLTLNANGGFTFATALDDLSDYLVTVLSQPDSPPQFCTVDNDSGSVNGANVTNVSVSCVSGLIGFSTPSLAFSVAELGELAPAQAVQISSLGSVALELQMIGISGPQAADFSIASNNCDGQVLAQGESCTVEVDFAPLHSGRSSASLEVQSSDAGSPHTVDLTGTVEIIFADSFEDL